MSHFNELCRDLKEFGIGFSIKSGISRILHNNLMLEKTIYSYLKKENRSLFNSFNNATIDTEITEKKIVWTFWWQGMETLPDILKVCYGSHLKNISGTDIDYRVITKDNYKDYVDIPPIIMNRMRRGEISFTHFSDYLRVCLLEQYGGAWIDITLLVSTIIDKNIFDYSFYSFNLGLPISSKDGIGKIATQTKWAGFMMCASRPKTDLFVYLRKAMTDYWVKHRYAINFFFMNILIRLAYDEIPSVKNVIDQIPLNNKELYNLQPIINDKFDESRWIELQKDTVFFKLTQKKEANEVNDRGEESFYGYLKRQYMPFVED